GITVAVISAVAVNGRLVVDVEGVVVGALAGKAGVHIARAGPSSRPAAVDGASIEQLVGCADQVQSDVGLQRERGGNGAAAPIDRSEERRVGREGGSRRGRNYKSEKSRRGIGSE